MTDDVLAAGTWKNNGELIADVARLGHLDGSVLDMTYGKGRFWSVFRPERMVTNDRYKPADTCADFRSLPFESKIFDTVVFDPPYRLNGTPDQDFDSDYGIDQAMPWQERMTLIVQGTAEALRLARRRVLVKCQDQVVSGAVRFQTDAITTVAAAHRFQFRKIDRFDIPVKGRKQPEGRRQIHARNNRSTLLVLGPGKAKTTWL